MGNVADELTKKVLTRVALCLIIPTFLGIVIYFDYSHFVNQFQVLQLDFKGYSKESNILLKLNDLSIIHGIQYIYQKSDPIESFDDMFIIEISKKPKFISYVLRDIGHVLLWQEQEEYEIQDIRIKFVIELYDSSSSDSKDYYLRYKNEFQIGNLYYSLHFAYPYSGDLDGNQLPEEAIDHLKELSMQRISKLLQED